MVHMEPKSQAGTLRLTSADPRAVPEINMNFFLNNADADLTEMLDGAKFFREALKNAATTDKTMGPWTELHPCPGKIGTAQCSDDAQKDYMRTQVYSHHATSTCAMGAASDPMAVVDSKFRVKGVTGLRVVDGSVFPHVPGAFPVLPTFMLAEKATDDLLAAAKSM
jgi:choline dehydrogenase